MSLKPTLLLALCPESSFPFPHPATWTKLRHAERASIFTQRPAPPTAVTAQTPFRTAVREDLFHPLCCEERTQTSHQIHQRSRGMISTQTVTACLPVRCPVIHISLCFLWVYVCFTVLSGIDLLTFGQYALWLTAVSGLKVLLPCGSYCLMHEHKASFHDSIIPFTSRPST